MKHSKFFLIILIINLLINAQLANSNNIINDSLEINDQNQTIDFNLDNYGNNITLDNPENIDMENETEQEEFKNNETFKVAIESFEFPKLQRPDQGVYITSPITNYKYEIKKIGNRKYQYIREGKTFNSLEEIKKKEVQNNNENFYKIRNDLQDKIKQNKTDEKVRVLINLKPDTVQIRQNIEEINEKYEADEKTIKSKIYEISSKYSPKSKFEIAESKVTFTKNEINRISEEGKKLEETEYKKIKELNSKLIEEGNEGKNRFIDWVENNGGELKSSTNTLSFISVEVPLSIVNEISSRPDVISIELDDNKIEPKLDISIPTISANSLWNAGYKGSWVDVAVADSGIDTTHSALNVDSEGSSRTFIAQDFTSSGTSDDTNGHGTHVAGIIASSDSTYKGVSPGVDKLINAKHIGGVSSDTLAALDWAITNPSDGAEILSNSWGLGVSSCNDIGFTFADGNTIPWTLYIDAAVDYYSILSINAAGNEGLCGIYSLSPPADSYNAIVVGAIDDQGTTSRNDDVIAPYSSIGYTWDNRKKPDIVAPGNFIRSTANDWEGTPLGFDYQACDDTHTSGFDFIELCGTSMAAPHVSGATALLKEYGISSMGIKALLINTAQDKSTSGWDAYYGWGELDLNNTYIYRNYVIDDMVNEGSYKLYKIQQILNGEKATLAWNRHVIYAGATTPSTWYDINDLDLELYRESDGDLQAYSTSIKDNVEQVVSSSQFLDGVVKVNAYTTDFNHGLNTEEYSLATQGGYALANGPILNINQNIPSSLNDSSNFEITATVSNIGDLDGHNIVATLNLPSGLTIVSGSNPQNIGSIPDGNSRNVSWVVKVDSLGIYNNIYSSFASESYGELSGENTSKSSITITDDDLTPPTFNEVNYPLINKTYNSILIKANIIDPSDINSTKLYYDYGDDNIIDGFIVMTLNENLYNAEIPSSGNNYKNEYIRFFIEAFDNDNDRPNDSTSGNSTSYYVYIENDPPKITSYVPLNQNQSLDESNILEFNHTPIDLDGDSLSYSWYLDNVLNATTQNFTYHPNFTDAGIHNLTLIVSDGINSTSTYWNINVNNVNVAPTWSPIPENQVIEEDTVFSYNVNAIDFDNDPITYLVNNTEFSINQDGLITWIPASDWNGIRYITITASDGIDNISATILVEVVPVNDAPVLTQINNIEINESNLVTISPEATDVENDVLTFSYSTPLNSSGKWQTDFSSAGEYKINVSVSDGNGGFDSQEVLIIVNKDTDEDYIPDFIDEDDDNDGILDNLDKLTGNLTNIQHNLGSIKLLIENDTNLSQELSGIKEVRINDDNESLIIFNFDFNNTLNFDNITIKKQQENNRDSLIIKGINLPSGETKTVYINKLDTASNSVCIKDAEINDISEISSTCTGNNEFIVLCPGNNSTYSCVIEGSKLKITGLLHSGIKEYFVTQTTPPSDGGSSGGAGGGSSGGGGGSGGGGSSITPPQQEPTQSTPGITLPNTQPSETQDKKETQKESKEEIKPETQKSWLRRILDNFGGIRDSTARVVGVPFKTKTSTGISMGVLALLVGLLLYLQLFTNYKPSEALKKLRRKPKTEQGLHKLQ